MDAGDTITRIRPRLRGLAGVALWAAAGGLVLLIGWYGGEGLASAGLNLAWESGNWSAPYGVSLAALVCVLPYSGLLGFAAHRAGFAGWRRASGFALLAAPWFVLAFNSGVAIYEFGTLAFANSWLTERVLSFLIWFGGLFVGGVWLALIAVALAPALRARRPLLWLLAGGSVCGLPQGTVAAVNFFTVFYDMDLAFAGWCTLHSAVFVIALRVAQGNAGAVPPEHG